MSVRPPSSRPRSSGWVPTSPLGQSLAELAMLCALTLTVAGWGLDPSEWNLGSKACIAVLAVFWVVCPVAWAVRARRWLRGEGPA